MDRPYEKKTKLQTKSVQKFFIDKPVHKHKLKVILAIIDREILLPTTVQKIFPIPPL